MSQVMVEPWFMYGTAWKESRTRALVSLAVGAGFRAFDTANQRKHYHEAEVGEALFEAISRGSLTRSDLFLQTKFTYERGQDHRLPYDPMASLTTQVAQSFESSLEHLRTDYLDSYLLHGPISPNGIQGEDEEVWRAMEALHDRGLVRHLGVSNMSLDQVRRVHGLARVKPTFVQNRCYASTRWDFEVRRFCREQNIIYQGFSLLTANPQVLTSPLTASLAAKYGCGPEQIIFRFAQQVGMLPLTGTSRAQNMRMDLACAQFTLTEDELARMESSQR